MELVAFLGDDKENWGQITGLINRGEWDGVYLIKNKSTSGFPVTEKCTSVEIDTNGPILDVKKELMDKLKGKLKDFEVALSIASGSGKDHSGDPTAGSTFGPGKRKESDRKIG